jgi:hypothetical protein
MGYFRRFKLSDYTAKECKKQLEQLEWDITGSDNPDEIRRIMDEWACYRELLARHEDQNKSKLDKK